MDAQALKGWSARAAWRGCLALALLCATVRSAAAREHTPFAAAVGVETATSAARIWAEDAVLVYVENDEPVTAQGAAERWSYLFFSPASQKSRSYSVRDGRVLQAEDLAMDFVAPAVSGIWIDSGAALAVAEEKVGREFREKHSGALGTMLLARGAFQDNAPDQTTWVLVYTSEGQPSLFVVVDAIEGKVRRTWKG